MTFPTTHPALASAISARGYSAATAVQAAVLDADAMGRDLLVSAQTGSGKTVAFGMAMASTLLGDAERFSMASQPMALIIAPTRELAMQVQRELTWLYAETNARIVACVGGMDARSEARELQRGAHIVVGTPGRLRDHIERRRLDLGMLRTIVLDEADEMLDLGFREDLEFILTTTPETRQTLLFSATMPREIEQLARRYQRDAVRIETLNRNEQHADIEYQAIRVAPNDTENAVVNVIRYHEARAALVFCTTRESVKRLHARLVERGFSAVALSGELTQSERTYALQALRDGRARVLVATDVAARGLDLPDLALVIHADLPNDRETLLHRSGRTGRAGKKGLCTLIVPYNRRRKADALLAAAKLNVSWITAPTAEQIRMRDQERFHADVIFQDPSTEEEASLVAALQGARSADQIALALVRFHRERLPAPEDIAADSGPPPRHEMAGRGKPTASKAFADRDKRPARARHDDQRPMVWFRLNIGREQKADPRWLLPLICRAGNVNKPEIGSIRIEDRETRFQVAAEHADNFQASVRRAKNKEGQITRIDDGASGHESQPALVNVAAPRPTEVSRPKGPPMRSRDPDHRIHRESRPPEASVAPHAPHTSSVSHDRRPVERPTQAPGEPPRERPTLKYKSKPAKSAYHKRGGAKPSPFASSEGRSGGPGGNANSEKPGKAGKFGKKFPHKKKFRKAEPAKG